MTHSAPSTRYRDIRLCVTLKAAPDRVYAAFTSARELCVWWLDRAETNARNMGRLRMVWPSFGVRRARETKGVFVDLEPGRKVAWMLDPGSRQPGVPPLTTVFIEPKGRGCAVTLVHAGFAETPAGAKRLLAWTQHWEDCLAKLGLYLESGRTCKGDRLSFSDAALLTRRNGTPHRRSP